MIDALALGALVAATVPAVLILWNLRLYLPPVGEGAPDETLAVLIPARDEEANIEAAIRSVLASRAGNVRVVVGDDGSSDRTAEIVCEIADSDPRVSLLEVPEPGAGWCGKQHACQRLGEAAEADLLLFVDADVRLEPCAAGRLAAELRRRDLDLLSGVPHQATPTAIEAAVVPLIHFLLLGFLPMAGMLRSERPAFAAGCGQLMLVRREAWLDAGGHAAIRGSRHDGLRLPRAFRVAGWRTGLVDVDRLASCRMYASPGELWWGLSKNADEGMATPAGLLPWSLLLGLGQVAPVPLAVAAVATGNGAALPLAVGAAGLSWLARGFLAIRFRQRALGVLLHPVGVAWLLAVQWFALGRRLVGWPLPWRGRVRDPEAGR